MIRRRSLFAALLMGAGLMAAAPAAIADERPVPQMSMLGEGVVSAAPDMATIRIGVETRAPTAAEAMRENNERAQKLIDEAKARGVEARDVQTSNLSIFPVYEPHRSGDRKEPKLVGYSVSNEVIVRLRDLGSAGEAIGAMVEVGANQLNGISFGFADDAAMTDDARKAAIADARRKAELYAEGAGVKLGRILALSEERDHRPMPAVAMRSMAMDEAMPIEAGESSITVRVHVVWEIE